METVEDTDERKQREVQRLKFTIGLNFKFEDFDICKHNPKFFSKHIREFDILVWRNILVLLGFLWAQKDYEK